MAGNHNIAQSKVLDYQFQSSTTDELLLADNLRVHPDVLIGNGNGIFGSGIQGSGKTGILARILEQASQFHIPLVLFDREGDLLPAVEKFPRGVLGTYQNCPSAKDVVKHGLQVVYDLSTWQSMDDKGTFIARTVNGLFSVVDKLPVSHRTPCLIGLDEAALFLPQRRGDDFSIEVYKAMVDAFHQIATMGRKRGLTPVLFTQKIGEINKLVLSPGTYIMLKQVVHTDLKRYLDYIERTDIFQYMTERQMCQFISTMQPGRAIVKLSTGEQKICQFYERESVHISHTPKVQAALNLYANQKFNANTRFGAYIEDDQMEVHNSGAVAPNAGASAVNKKVHNVNKVAPKKKDTRPRCSMCKKLATHRSSYKQLQRRTSGHTSVKTVYTYQCGTHIQSDSQLLGVQS